MTHFHKITPNAAKIFCALCFATLCFFSLIQVAQAQFSADRLTLTDKTSAINIGSYMHMTQDVDGSLNYNAIISRHINNIRGKRYERDILSLGYPAGGNWILFSADNQTEQSDWVLDFGSSFTGRQAMATKLLVRNHTRSETYARAMREKGRDGANGQGLQNGKVQITVTPGATELFVVYIEAAGPFAKTIAPRILSQDTITRSADRASFFSQIFMIGLISVIAFFIALAVMHHSKYYTLFSVYFILHALTWTALEHITFLRFELTGNLISLIAMINLTLGVLVSRKLLNLSHEDRKEDAILYLLGIAALAGAASLSLVFGANSALHVPILISIILAVPLALSLISAQQAKYGNKPAVYLALGWAISFVCTLLTIASSAQIVALSALFLNMYWLGILAQGICFIIATIHHAKIRQEEEDQVRARAGREAQTMMRLRQSKESADQARLLRVIEREREVLAELREREMQRTEEMRTAKELADSANEAKSAFLAVVSHEVRTPMTGIMGMVRLLLGTQLSKEQNEYAGAIKNSGETMMVLLNDILDFEKIESGNMQLENIDFDFSDLVQGVKTLMSGHASGKDITLKTDIPANFPRFVKGDPTRIRQVILNLTNNAIKFTDKGAVVLRLKAVELENTPESVIADYEISMIVEDSGIGISEEARQKLFTPFTQAEESTARKYGGTGLGLAICKKLIDAMGGTIGVNSVEGQGSTFFFNLLMERGEETEAMKVAGLEANNSEDNRNDRKMTILVIEDNDVNRRVLHGMLEQKGHGTEMAKNGNEALKIIENQNFDLIISDINMDGMDGFETTKHIRALDDETKRNTPIIALTGNVQDKDIASYYEAGMNGFLAKPIDTDKLYDIVMRAGNGELDNIIQDSPAEGVDIDTTIAPALEMQADPFPLPADNVNFNQSMLMNLLETLGKVPFDELLNSYYEQTDTIIVALESALKDEDFEIIRDRGHELKGMAGNFGMSDVSDLAKYIERAGKDKDLETAQENIPQLNGSNAALKKAVNAWRDSL